MIKATMKPLLASLCIVLTACGGGDVGDVTITCSVANACPVTVGPNTIGGSVTIGGPNAPPPAASAPAASAPPPATPAASAPSPAASAPVASAPTESVPLGRVVTTPPIRDEAGNLRWTSGGRTYQVRVFNGTFATWAALYSYTGVPADNTTLIAEALLDDALDIHSAEVANDAAIRAWLTARIVPALNAWLIAHPMDVVPLPVSSAAVPATLTSYDRAAARLPQWVVVSGSPARASVRP